MQIQEKNERSASNESSLPKRNENRITTGKISFLIRYISYCTHSNLLSSQCWIYNLIHEIYQTGWRNALRVNWWRCCSIEWATNTEYVKKVDKKNEHKNISVNKIKKEEISFSMFQLVLIIFCKNIPKKEKKRKNEISSTSFFLYWLCLLLAMCHLLLRRSSFAIV